MGHNAAGVLYHKEDILEAIRRTGSTNMLAQAVAVYLSNPFVLAGIEALANFTKRLTFPYLNFSEHANQKDCVELLPSKYEDVSMTKK